MKLKLIFSTFLFLSATFCHAQKLTPEILHGQWQAVAFYLPGEFFYNLLTDSFSVENKSQQLEELRDLLKKDSINVSAYDSLKKKVKTDIQNNILSFDESGNMIINQATPTPLVFLFSKKKAKFNDANIHGPNMYLDASLQNGLLMVTLSVGSKSRTVWAQKIGNANPKDNSLNKVGETEQYLIDNIARKKRLIKDILKKSAFAAKD